MSAWHTHVKLLEAVPKPRQWHQWSSEDVRLLTESRQAGMKIQDIAHKMERPILSIKIKMHRLKLTQPKHRWTTEEDNKLLLLHSKGLSWPIIGEMLGRSRSACCNHYHDIPKNQTPLPARETGMLNTAEGKSLLRPGCAWPMNMNSQVILCGNLNAADNIV